MHLSKGLCLPTIIGVYPSSNNNQRNESKMDLGILGDATYSRVYSATDISPLIFGDLNDD